MDYYGLRGRDLSGVVATALDLTASKMWELLWGGRGWGSGKVFEREQGWQMLRNQWFWNLHRMHFLSFPADTREDFILKKDL